MNFVDIGISHSLYSIANIIYFYDYIMCRGVGLYVNINNFASIEMVKCCEISVVNVEMRYLLKINGNGRRNFMLISDYVREFYD